jgi:glycyl-tRNA synthetase beta chain
MQGIMGRYQALRDGEPEELAQALDEFYMPRFSGDRLPQSKTGIAISLAEKIDTLVGIFGIGMKPTGDKDPFALRRAALGALRILREHALPLNLKQLLEEAERHLGNKVSQANNVDTVYNFMIERLKGIYADDGTPHDLFEAVATVQPESIADFEHRVRAVTDFRKLAAAEALAAANKRIGNILRKADQTVPGAADPELFEMDAERELYEQIEHSAEKIRPLMKASDYGATLQTLSGLRKPVDRFFDDVMVMAEDPSVRGNRLALLASLSRQFLQVADLSRLQS